MSEHILFHKEEQPKAASKHEGDSLNTALDDFESLFDRHVNMLGKRVSDLEAQLAECIVRMQELNEKLHLDALTGLRSKAALLEELEAIESERKMQYERRERHREKWLFFIDLDGFKAVNDTYGHDVGDTILKAAAAAIRSVFRKDDQDGIFRRGGDEFVIMLKNVSNQTDALHVADRVRSEVKAALSTYTVGELEIRTGVTASIGVVGTSQNNYVKSKLEKLADYAMYCAKGEKILSGDTFSDVKVSSDVFSAGSSVKDRICYMDEDGTIKLFVPNKTATELLDAA